MAVLEVGGGGSVSGRSLLSGGLLELLRPAVEEVDHQVQGV
ncbi:hypothetical protein chiPu_0033624, partial [Chiloscyllium punctatum]|nr:hypothetical protein [Chiloscyllium punctatum]